MNAIVGTAGHIDHGKTVLVRGLTGIDTDRLPEERRRGISIELGFAWMDLPLGRVGIVDVPGHERFIRAMMSGAQGFDLVMVVVAADDGVMPQTEEHFEIIHLLGVRRAIFVISKCDLADDLRKVEVRSEIEILVAGTPFENSPVVEVSAGAGQGLDELKLELSSQLKGLERAADGGPFRMPVDRAFLLKGQGLIVTGTACGGSIGRGGEVEIMPRGRRARVRSLQVHGNDVESARNGQRVALNLAAVDKLEAGRGDSVVSPGLSVVTRRFDALVEVRPSAGRELRSGERVRVYMGTADLAGHIVWLDGVSSCAPRSSAYAQLVLKREAVAFRGDRFVIRDETAQRTLGGGTVLLARAGRHPPSRGKVAPVLEALGGGSDGRRLSAFLELGEGLGQAPGDLAPATGLEGDQLARAVKEAGVVLLPSHDDPSLFLAGSRYHAYLEDIKGRVGDFHRRNPFLAGVELEHLRTSLAYTADAPVFRSVIERLLAQAELVRSGSRVALPEHEVSMDEADEAVALAVVGLVAGAAAMPPSCKELAKRFTVSPRKLNEILSVLSERGDLVRVSPQLVFAREVIDKIESDLRKYLTDRGEISAAAFRDLISASRKYCIPLLDYFDHKGVTMRSGDLRRLRRPGR